LIIHVFIFAVDLQRDEIYGRYIERDNKTRWWCYLQCDAHWHITHYYAIFSVCPCCQPSYRHRQLSRQLTEAVRWLN